MNEYDGFNADAPLEPLAWVQLKETPELSGINSFDMDTPFFVFYTQAISKELIANDDE